MATVAGDTGYSRRGRLFWKRGPQLTKLVDLQASRWGKGVYVNFGVLPKEMVIGKVPPDVGYAGISERGEHQDGPYRGEFERCAYDDADHMPAEAMRRPLQWLIEWIEDNLTDADAVRQSVLNDGPPLFPRNRPFLFMKDWARGQLKEPLHYFEDTPYYRRKS